MATSGGEQQLKVLLIDDNVELLRALTMALEELGGFTIVSAKDGVEGLEKFFEVAPDCVVIDISMPELDGYQLVRALRGDPQSAATPLVILTALAQDRDKYAGMAYGADVYLVKPIKPQDLIEVIHRTITLTKDERKLRLQRFLEEEPPTQ